MTYKAAERYNSVKLTLILLCCVSFCWDEKLDRGLALNCDATGVKLCEFSVPLEYSVSHSQPTSVVNITSFLTFVDCKYFECCLECVI